MGRKIRMVPANWDHPKSSNDDRLQPMYDQNYERAATKWKADFAAHDPSKCDGEEYWEYYGNPPEREYYRPWKDEDATWFQLWETVSEGTPVSPPFATKEALALYLAENGDFWDQKRCWNRGSCETFGMTYGEPGWGMDRARAFVEAGWAPSMAIMDGEILASKDINLALKDKS